MSPLIYLLRHTEIDRSFPRRFLGQTDLPLNDNGLCQAQQLSQTLSHIPFCLIFSSPLHRAMQTATLASGGSMDAIRPVRAFAEINLGAWEGLTVAEVQQRFPGAYEERGRDLAHFRPPGGESFVDVADRALPALLEIAHSTPGPLLIVAHAGVNRALLCCLLQRPLAEVLHIPQDYGAINILEQVGERLRVKAINQITVPATRQANDQSD